MAHRPALILLDINLPEMDGYAVLDRLRGNEVTRHIPVVAVTANVMNDLGRGEAEGFSARITKPVDINKLMQTLDGFLD